MPLIPVPSAICALQNMDVTPLIKSFSFFRTVSSKSEKGGGKSGDHNLALGTGDLFKQKIIRFFPWPCPPCVAGVHGDSLKSFPLRWSPREHSPVLIIPASVSGTVELASTERIRHRFQPRAFCQIPRNRCVITRRSRRPIYCLPRG